MVIKNSSNMNYVSY